MCFEWGSGIEVRREESCTGLIWRGFDVGKQAEMVITDWWESSGIERTEGVSGYGWIARTSGVAVWYEFRGAARAVLLTKES
jgi:hypothetical protein